MKTVNVIEYVEDRFLLYGIPSRIITRKLVVCPITLDMRNVWMGTRYVKIVVILMKIVHVT